MRSFKIYSKWSVQTNKQTSIHTRVRNAVTLVWGSLRLAPITVGHWPKSAHTARLAAYSTQRSVLWPDKRCACACDNQMITTCTKMLSHQNKRNSAVGSSDGSKTKRSKRQVSKGTFLKWQRTYEREHQSVVWLRADMVT